MFRGPTSQPGSRMHARQHVPTKRLICGCKLICPCFTAVQHLHCQCQLFVNITSTREREREGKKKRAPTRSCDLGMPKTEVRPSRRRIAAPTTRTRRPNDSFAVLLQRSAASVPDRDDSVLTRPLSRLGGTMCGL